MNKKILIIDDDKRNIFALNATLKAEGYQCITSLSADEGLALLNHNKEIGIILMDMMLPEMDGYEAIKKIRGDNKLKELPVIAITAQAMAGDREKCLEAGADDYIAKPVNVNALLSLLKKYLN